MVYINYMNERNWGGKRRGAGRKKGGVIYKTISVVLPEEEAELLKQLAERHRMTVSRFVSKYLGLRDTLQVRGDKEC